MQQPLKILVTGSRSQLAQALKEVGSVKDKLLFTGKSDLDITDSKAVQDFLKTHKPDIVINTAAFTQVDVAESHRVEAFLVNARGVENLALACRQYNCKLIHLSTDYVFDGKARTPYQETDLTNPETVYGQSKRAGEQAIQNSGLSNYAIIRTSWLYSTFGNNFYKTMLQLAGSHKELKVVNDQTGCPTSALELARALWVIAHRLSPENAGIYHYCQIGETTWYGFAKAIFEKHQMDINLKPVSSSEFPTVASRPAYSVLDTQKVQNIFGLKILSWNEALKSMNDQIISKNRNNL